MRRKVLIFGLVVALMSMSLTALADGSDDPDEGELKVESVEATVDHTDYMEWLGNGRVETDEEYVEFGFDFGEADTPEGLNHGLWVSGLVSLLKDPANWYVGDALDPIDDPENFDVSHYRLGCLVRQFANSDLGKDSEEDPAAYLTGLDLEGCLKKQYVEDWEPPGKAKKDGDWEPPGLAKKNGD